MKHITKTMLNACHYSLLTAIYGAGYEENYDDNTQNKIYYCKGFSGRAVDALRPILPYCISRISDDKWIILNRDYKPLFCCPSHDNKYSPMVKYSDFEHLIISDSCADKFICNSTNYVGGGSIRYLFNDSCPPWAGKKHAVSYLTRLRKILGIYKKDF